MTAETPRYAATAARAAMFVTLIEAVGLLTVGVLYVIALAGGGAQSPGRAVASIALFVAGAAMLGLVARGWHRGEPWVRMATVVWSGLLIPLSFTVIRGNGLIFGMPLLVLAIVGVGVGLVAGAAGEG